MFAVLLRNKSRIAKNTLFSYRFHSRLRGAVVAVFLLTYLVGGYLLLREGFSFLQSFAFIGTMLLDRIMEIFFFALFFMLLMSQALFVYGAYFRSPETAYLRTLPVGLNSLFIWEFWESTLLSSWTFLFLSLPMLVAYAQARDIHFSYIGVFLLLFTPLVLLGAVAGTLAAFFIVRVWRSRSRWLWLASVALLLLAVSISGMPAGGIGGFAPDMHRVLDTMLSHTRFVQWPWWPSEWVSRAMLSFIKGQVATGLGYLWLLSIQAVFFVQGLFFIGGRLFARSLHWEIAHQDNTLRPRAQMTGLQGILRQLCGDQTAGFVVKDIKTFMRDPGQWSHFAIFFGLLGLYFFNLHRFRYESMGVYWSTLVTFLNLATVGLVAGTLSTRFFFPLPSLEMRRNWIWGVGGTANILWPKFILGFLFLTGITEALMWISCRMLHLEYWVAMLCMMADFFICMTVMGLALGLGAAFPVAKEEVSAKIVSGFGGTLCLVLTLAYLAFVVVSLAVPVHLYIVHKAISAPIFFRIMLVAGVLIPLVSLVLTGASLRFGDKSMRCSAC